MVRDSEQKVFKQSEEMYYLDGFSGYGGFRKAFELEGWKFKKVWFSEIDKYAIANYKHNFPESEYAGSITDIQGLPNLDLFTFGWPCQGNSIAGKRAGHKPGSPSHIFFSAISCIERFKPRNFIAENVRGFSSVNEGIDFIEAIKILSHLNESLPQYEIEVQLLDTLWFLPQKRQRYIFIGSHREECRKQIFPIGEGKGWNDKESSKKGTQLAGVCRSLTTKGGGRYDYETESYIEVIQGSKTLMAKEGQYVDMTFPKSNTRRGVIDNVSHALDHNARHCVVQDGRLRCFTPLERERLHGLPDDWTKWGNFNGEIKQISDTQRYKLTGNGVSIPPVREIAKRLKNSNPEL